MHHRSLFASTTLLALLAACSAPIEAESLGHASTALGSGLSEVTGFGANPGGLKMYEHVPASLPANPALVVVLHGCTLGAADIAQTGWNDLADKLGFVVVYPEQTTTNNQMRCFNWGGVYGDLSKIARGQYENESVKEMVDESVAAHGVDPKRVFVAGFSAGGGEAAVLAATWPDVFAAGATIAGIPYHCASSFADAFTCMKPGITKTPEQWATLVKSAYDGYAGPSPRMSIWQGAADGTVAPANRGELVKQWTQVHGAGQTPSATDTIDGAAHTVFKDASGNVVVESFEVPGMDHGVAIDPKNGCGTAGSYAIDKGICTAALVVGFFGIGGATTGSSPGAVDGGTSSSSSSSTGGDGAKSAAGAAAPSATGATSTTGASADSGSADSTCALRPASTGSLAGAGMLAAIAALLGARRRRARSTS